MMDELKDENHLAACSDIVSLVLLGFAIFVADVDPRRRVWGHSKLRGFLIILAVAINVIFSLVRLIYECVRIDTGPREFLLASVIYCLRWIWLYVNISRSRSGRAFKVALHLKQLQMIRLGASKREPNPEGTQSTSLSEGLRALFLRVMNWKRASESATEASKGQMPKKDDGRKGEKELVIRRGERNLPRDVVPYWRGVEEHVQAYESQGNKMYFVRLVEQELHTSLDEIGTIEYKRRLDVEGINGLYKKTYNLVMTCDLQWPDLRVDYKPFLKEYSAISATTALAEQAGATSETPLGQVARRVAADACRYVTDVNASLSTEPQVKLINECIEEAAKTCLSNYTVLRETVSDSGGENTASNNGDSNV